MITVSLLLLVFAFVLLTVAALGIPSAGRVNVLAAGLACWVLANLIGLIKW